MTCENCYWKDKCHELEACEDYTPIVDEPELEQWSLEEYLTYVSQYADGNWDLGEFEEE